ncbi:hypothetical protein HID58_079123 [Brassica napus]|uniref:Uncharacterized protein n=1 Tax=Brassica napus TaxID=3708 RepID=A0ABQ7Y2T6_BRANA|nr:hypothetical protein HID58_079123 [Brassica napus]
MINQEDRDRTSARTCSDQVTGRDGGISTETRLQILQRSAENQLYLQKDKNQGETSDLAEPAKATNPFSNDNSSILLGEKEKAQGETPRQNALHHMDKEIVPFKETEGEQELANPIDDLTEGEMEEEMLENDDLLDEDFEIRTGEADETFEEGEIKALSHLLPDKAGRQQSPAHAPRPTRTKAEQTKDKKVAKGSKDDKAVRGALGYTNQTRKRGARSPDIKGTAASNKLATRGRMSPKPKQMKPARDMMMATRQSTKNHALQPG